MAWQPRLNAQGLRQRARALALAREFFQQRDVIEVDTPVIGRSTITDPQIEALCVTLNHQHQPFGDCYLQTSPEYFMKRLLAANAIEHADENSPLLDFFQLGKVFRDNDLGRNHQIEFTLLEWYRQGFGLQQMINETLDFCCHFHQHLGGQPLSLARSVNYVNAFIEQFGVHPEHATDSELRHLITEHGLVESVVATDPGSTLVQLLFSTIIEPQLFLEVDDVTPLVITGYPLSQAALATSDPASPDQAQRFEVYLRGIELANGYVEESDAQVLRDRFRIDNQQRRLLGRTVKPVDEEFLAAHDSGLPACAGVALGFDRLLMVTLNKNQLAAVLPFPL